MKSDRVIAADLWETSHPTGVRGLKWLARQRENQPAVAPHWGAWIEIVGSRCCRPPSRRTPLGCVD